MKQTTPVFHMLPFPFSSPPSQKPELLPVVSVGPVRITPLLDKGHLVRQTNLHSFTLNERHRWGGDLEEIVAQFLVNSLAKNLESEAIYLFPENTSTKGFRVEITLLHFEQNLKGQAVVGGRWHIVSVTEQKICYSATSLYTIETEGSDIDYLIAGLGKGLSLLGQEISDQLLLLSPDTCRSHL